MKKVINYFVLVCILIGIGLINSCKKDHEIPTLTTNVLTNITINTATTGGVITSDGGAEITTRGVCWSTTSKPAVTDLHTTDDKGAGSFTSKITGLNPNTFYYVRTYATNSVGTAYGNEISFTTTPIVVPSLTTTAVTSITLTTAVSGGNITSDGGAPITSKGTCWSTSAAPTINNSKTVDGTGTGTFISNISGLQPATKYYVRSYAGNSAGTAYGNEISFTTSQIVVPTITTSIVTSVTLTTAVSGGSIVADGGGPITAKGVCWSTSTAPAIDNFKTVDGTGSGTYASNLTSLTPGTKYYVRAYATNSAGTAYGLEVNFTTNQIGVPTLTTTAVTSITLTTAVSGGNITSDGGGSVTARGICWASTTDPTISDSKTTNGTGIGSFISNLVGLVPNTTYYVRSYATNSAGTTYGDEVTFTTNPIVVPSLTTTTVTSITLTTAASGGNIINDGGGTISARGICWDVSTSPAISDSKTTDGDGTGSFTSNLTGLTPGTTYYVRSYSTNEAGTSYGNEISFTTGQIVVPTLTTTAISSITALTAASGGTITNDGGGSISAKGICWATTSTPTISNFTTSEGIGTGSFASSLTGLTPGTTYYVRSYATNSTGTGYGNTVSFETLPIVVPTVSTMIATSITLTTAASGGTVSSDGNGTISARGVCWATTTAPTTGGSKTTDGTGTGDFTSNIAGLTPGTIYYVRAYATNSAGTAYGNERSFTTVAVVAPTVTTTAVTSIGVTTAASGGNVTADGGGNITARGVCWSTTANPTTSNPNTTDGTGTGVFTSSIAVLAANTTYYLRAYATNSAGTSYGAPIIFKTFAATDIEGSGYYSVTIGTQTWLTENLKTKTYSNGDPISTTTSTDISGETAPKYQWAYGDNEANAVIYGRLYTYYTVTDSRGICPTGWHVPSDAEWTTLHDYLTNNGFAFTSGLDDIGKSMAAKSGWAADLTPGNVGNDQASNNSSGFKAIPGGFRKGNDGTWVSIGQNTYWFSTTVGLTPGSSAWYRNVDYNYNILGRNDYGPWNGYSVRCVK